MCVTDDLFMFISSKFLGSVQERDKVIPLIIQGFKDASEEAGTSVTGGQTVLNPWVVMGGVATTVCQPNEFIMWEPFPQNTSLCLNTLITASTWCLFLKNVAVYVDACNKLVTMMMSCLPGQIMQFQGMCWCWLNHSGRKWLLQSTSG